MRTIESISLVASLGSVFYVLNNCKKKKSGIDHFNWPGGSRIDMKYYVETLTDTVSFEQYFNDTGDSDQNVHIHV